MSALDRSTPSRFVSAVTVMPWLPGTGSPVTDTRAVSILARRSRSAGTRASASSKPGASRMYTIIFSSYFFSRFPAAFTSTRGSLAMRPARWGSFFSR